MALQSAKHTSYQKLKGTNRISHMQITILLVFSEEEKCPYLHLPILNLIRATRTIYKFSLFEIDFSNLGLPLYLLGSSLPLALSVEEKMLEIFSLVKLCVQNKLEIEGSWQSFNRHQIIPNTE